MQFKYMGLGLVALFASLSKARTPPNACQEVSGPTNGKFTSKSHDMGIFGQLYATNGSADNGFVNVRSQKISDWKRSMDITVRWNDKTGLVLSKDVQIDNSLSEYPGNSVFALDYYVKNDENIHHQYWQVGAKGQCVGQLNAFINLGESKFGWLYYMK